MRIHNAIGSQHGRAHALVLMALLFLVSGCDFLAPHTRSPGDGLPNLVAHWTLDDCIRIDEYRCVSVEHRDSLWNAIVVGGQVERGQIGKSIALDGIDDFIYVSQAGIRNVVVRSIQFWFMKTNATIEPTPGKVDREGLVVKAFDTGLARPFYFALGGLKAPFNVGFFASAKKDSVSLPGVFSADVVEPRRWYHVVGTISRDSLRLYINGEPVGATHFDGEPIISPAPIVLGKIAAYSESTRFFRGLIDDLRLYDRPLSSSEVRRLYRRSGEG